MATLSDVAALAGVSISAVSRVLSDAPATRVRPETRTRIQAAARELGYRPNFAARALKLARSNVIALVVPDLTNAVFTELMIGVQERARGHDYMVLLGSTEDLHPDADVMERLIGEGRVDGMLVQLGSDASREGIAAILDTKAPVIFINSIESGRVGAVALDDDAGARIATEHLIALGHTRIALAGGEGNSFTAQRRERGFRAAMESGALEVPGDFVTSFGYRPTDGRAALRTLMALRRPPTAVVVANVNAAIGALAESRRLGVRIPEKLSVVAMHDAWTAENTWPPLTTVKMPLRELGRRAFDSLFARLHGGGLGDIVVGDPAPELIIRESTSALRR